MIDSNLISACEELMKRHSASFYAAFRFLPSPRKEAVFVIYAFCRMIDDSVDEPESSPYTLSELETLFDHLETAEGHFIWPCLRWLFSSFPISKEPFYKQISGQKMDTTLTNYETMEELELYCERVAGSVGEMLLPVLHDQPSSEVELAGVYLGKAMQIVNIIRDVGEDQQRGRRYIPREWMEQYHYTQEEFETNVVNFRFKRMLTGLMNVAEDWFSKGLENIDTYPENSAFSIKLAAGYYAAIMEAVRHNEYQVYTSRAIVSDKKKKMILLAALQGSIQNEVHSIEA
ncbi:phytoene synthase [Bacillus sp. SLBN-46]|uniref:phytoene/squalene synthase family protein n=1 Tax=Bacillus sp. SLBN-46 TaxID=3042283 RepID=UPI002864C520|nr:phytoene/squalene synthase family protein [Bacillus sp. SLBN-46]MDR6124122.1 phytoene synthase [Bacillus sp. SLBN-46]